LKNDNNENNNNNENYCCEINKNEIKETEGVNNLNPVPPTTHGQSIILS